MKYMVISKYSRSGNLSINVVVFYFVCLVFPSFVQPLVLCTFKLLSSIIWT